MCEGGARLVLAESGFDCVEDGDALSTCLPRTSHFWHASGAGFLRLLPLGGTGDAQGWVQLNEKWRQFAKGLFRTGTNNAASEAFVAKAFACPCALEGSSALHTDYNGTVASLEGSVPFNAFDCFYVIAPDAASVAIHLDLDGLAAHKTVISVWDDAKYLGPHVCLRRSSLSEKLISIPPAPAPPWRFLLVSSFPCRRSRSTHQYHLRKGSPVQSVRASGR